MATVWCAAIECEHNKDNQCTADKINLSYGHVNTVHQGFMDYWTCRMFKESAEAAKLREMLAEFMQTVPKRRKPGAHNV